MRLPDKRLVRCAALFPLLVIGLTLAPSSQAGAAQTAPSCTYLPSSQPDSKYAFTQATLIALSYARAAVQEADQFQAERTSETNAQTLLIATMRHTKNASEAYECAEMVLGPYKKSSDRKIVRAAADHMAGVYRQHKRLNDQFLDLLRGLPAASDQFAKTADVISTIEVERGKLWDDLTKGTTLTLLGLIDSRKADKDGTLRTLLITRAAAKGTPRPTLTILPRGKDPGGQARHAVADLHSDPISPIPNKPVQVRGRIKSLGGVTAMYPWFEAVVISLVCFLSFTTVSSAECAWVLWTKQALLTKPASAPEYALEASYQRVEDCTQALDRRFPDTRGRATATVVMWGDKMWMCLPDTVDPRGPKAM